ncbi:MAG: glycosyltransferase family 2 protein [bacterium]|nr:glycosyltransferase family 2 protein [bacterium]
MPQEMLSVVMPCYNEEDVLNITWQRLRDTLVKLEIPWEVIFIDDGSTDRTLEIIQALRRADERVKYLSFSRNFGQQVAYSAGLQCVRGSCALLLDADLQDSPEYLRDFIKKHSEGYQVVYGIRARRKEGWLLRSTYSLFYRLMSSVSGTVMPRDAGDFALIDRVVVDAINSAPERNRFLRGLRSWAGFRQTGVVCERAARAAGEAKYNLVRLTKLALDGILSFSYVPLYAFSYAGFVVATASFGLMLAFLVKKLIVGTEPTGFPAQICTVLFLGGVQLIGIGVLGLYIARIYDEVKQRPLYVVKESAGMSSATEQSAKHGI